MVAFEPAATLSLWSFSTDLCIQAFVCIHTSVAESSFGSNNKIIVLIQTASTCFKSTFERSEQCMKSVQS